MFQAWALKVLAATTLVLLEGDLSHPAGGPMENTGVIATSENYLKKKQDPSHQGMPRCQTLDIPAQTFQA